MTHQPDLSTCMIVKNEAANIAAALSNFRTFSDEIVVVDTGSTDGTAEMAREFTSQVHDFPWIDDFSAARNHSFDRAHGRYFLWLDADDRFLPEDQDKIRALKQYFDGESAFYFILKNVHEDGGSSVCRQLRCVPGREDIRFEGRIHEQLLPSIARCGIKTVTTDVEVRHLGYKDREMCLSKLDRNLTLLKKEEEEGRNDGALFFFMAITYEAMMKRPEATAAMEKAVQRLERESSDGHLLLEGYLCLGELHEKTGDKDRSLRYAVKAQALMDNSPQRAFRLASLQQRLGRHNQAITGFKKALHVRETAPGLFPSTPGIDQKKVFLQSAYSHFCLKQYPLAQECLQTAWQSGLDASEGWEWIGTQAILSSRMDLAVQAFEAAQRSGKMSADGYYRLGSLYQAQGLPGKAARCFSEGLVVNPHHESILKQMQKAGAPTQ